MLGLWQFLIALVLQVSGLLAVVCRSGLAEAPSKELCVDMRRDVLVRCSNVAEHGVVAGVGSGHPHVQ